MDAIKHLINTLSTPQISFTILVLTFFFVFPPTEGMRRVNEKLRIPALWTKTGGMVLMALFFLFFAFGLMDENFRLIVTKPDNVPIVGLLFLVIFFLWFALKQGYDNDARIAQGKPPAEAEDAKEKVLVWPDLVYIELIAMLAVLALLLVWAMSLPAPLEEPANPTVSPNPSKAPWYFLGLQEMLVYFDPWIAGVVFPTLILLGLMSIPFIDRNPKGSGYYTFAQRPFAVSMFLFFWLVFWIFLITVGTFLRGPNWNFFGPFEYWDHHKLVALTNINLSELVYMVGLKTALPKNILLRELPGFLVLGVYFGVLPMLLAKTVFKNLYAKMGTFRYYLFIILFLLAMSLPIKMYLRWIFNIKYIVAIPEFFFNI